MSPNDYLIDIHSQTPLSILLYRIVELIGVSKNKKVVFLGIKCLSFAVASNYNLSNCQVDIDVANQAKKMLEFS